MECVGRAVKLEELAIPNPMVPLTFLSELPNSGWI